MGVCCWAWHAMACKRQRQQADESSAYVLHHDCCCAAVYIWAALPALPAVDKAMCALVAADHGLITSGCARGFKIDVLKFAA